MTNAKTYTTTKPLKTRKGIQLPVGTPLRVVGRKSGPFMVTVVEVDGEEHEISGSVVVGEHVVEAGS